jgi:hypothetical protein
MVTASAIPVVDALTLIALLALLQQLQQAQLKRRLLHLEV